MARQRGPAKGRLFTGEPDREVRDELEFHIEERVREYMATGMDAESARRAALERIGDLERVRDECAKLLVAERRSLARRDWFSDLLQDLRFALRTATRAPLFSLMAIVTLALGIGANSAVFGVVKSVLLDALPYGEPDRLVRVSARLDAAPAQSGALSAGTVHDLQERQRSFSAVGASSSGGPDAVLNAGDVATTVRLAHVSPDFFRTLRVNPLLGRGFDDADAATDTSQVIILSHAIWQQHFGADRDILGRTIQLNGLTRTVVGVLPRNFIHPVRHSDVYMPLNLEPVLANPVSARGSHFIEVVARLNPGVSAEAAHAEVAALGVDLAAEHPRENRGIGLQAERLHGTMAGESRTPLLVLMASAALVLLIACANLAAALLSRTIARRKEFAVRISLGAGRGRLVRQLLSESVLLAAVGGAVGLLVAYLGLAALSGANIEALPDYAELSLDRGAVVFTFVLALLTGVVFGLSPALSAGRAEPQAVLRDESSGSSGSLGSSRTRGVLVAAQVALCLSVLAGAGLLTRSLLLMASQPLGFETGEALSFNVPLSNAAYPTATSRIQFNDEMSARIGSLPGVTAVAVTNFLPTRVQNSNGVSVVDGPQPTDDSVPFILTTGASEDYFSTLGIPLLAGRSFTTADGIGSPPVAVVSAAMARRFWPEGDPLGAHIRVGPDPESTPIEVIGVVGDVRSSLAETEPEPMLYMPLRQGWWGNMFVVRTTGDPLGYVDAIREELAAYDAALPLAQVTTLRDVVDDALAPRRIPMLLMLSFGGLALLLVCVGIYAMFANMALAREREFGVRMALGSSRGAVATLVLRQGARWMAIGLCGGAIGVFAVSRALQSLVFGISPLDPVAISMAVGALILCAALALAVPVVRATRADPVVSMR